MNYREQYENHELRKVWNTYRYSLQREWGNRTACTGRLMWKAKLCEDARHLMCQNTHDYARRGQTNRNGSQNRRWRAWKATQPKVLFSCAFYELVA